jgi:hypothetical protein
MLNVSLLLQSLSLFESLRNSAHTEREVTAKWTENGRRKEKSDDREKKGKKCAMIV